MMDCIEFQSKLQSAATRGNETARYYHDLLQNAEEIEKQKIIDELLAKATAYCNEFVSVVKFIEDSLKGK